MQLSKIKTEIVEELYNISANTLPSFCESIGLDKGDVSEAFKSKRNYIRNRLYDYDSKAIKNLLIALKEKHDIEIIPMEKFKYQLTSITKREIIDVLFNGIKNYSFFGNNIIKINYYGLMDEYEFIKRNCDVNKIHSNEKSFDDEFHRHRVFNNDFDDDWFFTDNRFPFMSGNDTERLNILCDIFHPEVRDEKGEWKKILTKINSLLFQDGFIIYENSKISGRAKYGWRKLKSIIYDKLEEVVNEDILEVLSNEYLTSQIDIIKENINTRPDVAIGKSKEVIESILKEILDKEDIEYQNDEKLTVLDKKVRKLLKLDLDSNNERIPGIQKIFNGLSSSVSGMAELRNSKGDGHGKTLSFKQLPSRYAKLSAGFATTYITFLYETYTYFKGQKNK